MSTQTTALVSEPRDWTVTSIETSERSGLMVCGINNADNGARFMWHLGAKEFASSLHRFDTTGAVVTCPRVIKLLAFFKIAL